MRMLRVSMWKHFLFQGEESHKDEVRLLARVSEGLNGADIENIALAARRRAILSNQDSNLGQILLAVGASHTGSPRLLDKRELDTTDKKTLTRLLHEKGGINQSEIGKIVGVSRQMVHRYLKETLDG